MCAAAEPCAAADLCAAAGRREPRGRHGQRGDALLESLVGVVLASVVGLGLSYTTARMMVSQRYVASQNAVLSQMTGSLASSGVANLCAGTAQASVTVGATSVTLPTPTCTTAAVTISVSGGAQSATLPVGVVTSMSLSTPGSNTAATGLVGGNGILTISQ
jgi:prepilin peptidase dependent protein A